MGTIHLRTRDGLATCGAVTEDVNGHIEAASIDRKLARVTCPDCLRTVERRCTECKDSIPAHTLGAVHPACAELAAGSAAVDDPALADARVAPGQLPRTCTCCNALLTPAAWDRLPYLGRSEGLEWRNCSCGSTLTVELWSYERRLAEARAALAFAEQRTSHLRRAS